MVSLVRFIKLRSNKRLRFVTSKNPVISRLKKNIKIIQFISCVFAYIFKESHFPKYPITTASRDMFLQSFLCVSIVTTRLKAARETTLMSASLNCRPQWKPLWFFRALLHLFSCHGNYHVIFHLPYHTYMKTSLDQKQKHHNHMLGDAELNPVGESNANGWSIDIDKSLIPSVCLISLQRIWCVQRICISIQMNI